MQTIDYLMTLLQMADFFDMESLKAYAIARLNVHPVLTLRQRLQLCDQFSIIEWIDPNFRALHNHSLEVQTLDGLMGCDLPLISVTSLLNVTLSINQHRRALAFV